MVTPELPSTPGRQDLATGVLVVAPGAALPGAELTVVPVEGSMDGAGGSARHPGPQLGGVQCLSRRRGPSLAPGSPCVARSLCLRARPPGSRPSSHRTDCTGAEAPGCGRPCQPPAPPQAGPALSPAPSGQRLSSWWRVRGARVCAGRGCREGRACFPAGLEPGAQGASAGRLWEGRC